MKKKIKKGLISLTGGIVVIGTIAIIGVPRNNCNFELKNVNSQNLLEKMVNKIEKLPIDKNEYLYGCELEEVVISNSLFRNKKGVRYSDRDCKTKTKNEFKNFKEDNLTKTKNLNSYNYNEAKTISNDFLDIWNYHIMEKCGLVE